MMILKDSRLARTSSVIINWMISKPIVWLATNVSHRGRVWHPGGCHPFSGLNEALVHNGDFANYKQF